MVELFVLTTYRTLPPFAAWRVLLYAAVTNLITSWYLFSLDTSTRYIYRCCGCRSHNHTHELVSVLLLYTAVYIKQYNTAVVPVSNQIMQCTSK